MTAPAPFRLYNTLTRSVADFEPLEPGRVKLYVCGMTVYDDCHVGHARAMMWFDVVVRYLRHRGWDVTFVRNFTDIDDKIIQRALDAGVEPLDWAQTYIDHFHRDAAALGLLTPDHEPRVSECLDAIRQLIGDIMSQGHAYQKGGSVWFDVPSFATYGQLSNQNPDDLRASADAGDKKGPHDFALWKGSKPGEPSWPSDWGPGRPGWHIECSAMCQVTLGNRIDIHGGGLDLVFPHHENEVAQAEAGTGERPFANYWMHNGLLTMSSGQKMGKSLGNVRNIVDLLQLFPAEALRLYYLRDHYRSPLPWDETALPKALAMLGRLYDAREVAMSFSGSEPAAQVAESLGADALLVLERGQTFVERFHRAMDNDFNSADALGHAFELARAINRLSNHKKAKKRAGPVVAPALQGLEVFAQATGLLQQSYADFQNDVKAKVLTSLGITAADVEQLLQDRAAARAAKDWARADDIRDTLTSKRILVMDHADGVEWRVDLTVDE